MPETKESARESLRSVLRNPNLRRIQLAFGGSLIGDWAYAIAVSIWAYEQGGVTALGVFGVARYVTLAFCAPIASTFADRYPKRAVMVWCDLSRAMLVAIGAVVVATDGPALVICGRQPHAQPIMMAAQLGTLSGRP